jgi:hypothetical protein
MEMMGHQRSIGRSRRGLHTPRCARLHTLVAIALGTFALALAGCSGEIGDSERPPVEELPPDDPIRSTPIFHFEPEDPSTQPGVRRLTRHELERAIEDLTGVTPDVSDLPEDLESLNLQNDAARLTVRDGNHLLALMHVAHDVAVAADIDALLPCAGDCTDAELRAYLEHVFVEPLDAEGLADYRDVYDRALAELDPENARRAVIQSSLMSPRFHYRTELGGGGDRLTPHELAEKLSYFAWGRPPDAELRAKADDGSILEAEVYAAEVDRLLADARSEERVVELIFDWLGLDHFDLQSKDAAAALPAELEDSMIAEAKRMIRAELFEGDGTLRSLLTTDTTHVDELLAGHYGIDGVSGSELQPVSLEGTGRSGLLTTALVLGAHAKESGRSPMQRGKFLVDELMCMGFPPEAGAAAMMLPDGVEDLTFREQFAPLESTLPCSNCHQMLNAGFAFDVFDNVGRRYPLDRVGDEEAHGFFNLAPYEQMSFESTVEANQGFAEHGALVRCFVAQTHRYAQGSVPSVEDAELMEELEATFDANDGHVLNLMRDIALAERFQQPAEGS